MWQARQILLDMMFIVLCNLPINNNVLNINLSAALTAGLVRVQTAGTEE